MNKTLFRFAGLCTLAMAALWALPAGAQMAEVKEKPPMYSYVSFWNIPRAQWGEMEKADAADKPLLDKAVASGAIIGYGNDVNMVHQPDGSTTTRRETSRINERAGPVLQERQRHFFGIGERHQTLG